VIKGLHHSADRCRDSEETRAFYEGVLGLPLVQAMRIEESKTGREIRVLHTFYHMGDGSWLAFFEAPREPFDFKPQRDFDLHIALEVDGGALAAVLARARASGIEARGISDHGFVRSIYLRDPNGYVIELTAKCPGHDAAMDPVLNGARQTLAAWQAEKSEPRIHRS
jgi:catechol 2,3-dioxygenase-like lactoylglutathione lyase family enzyme